MVYNWHKWDERIYWIFRQTIIMRWDEWENRTMWVTLHSNNVQQCHFSSQFITAKCENCRHEKNWIIALRLPAIVRRNWPHGRNSESSYVHRYIYGKHELSCYKFLFNTCVTRSTLCFFILIHSTATAALNKLNKFTCREFKIQLHFLLHHWLADNFFIHFLQIVF